MSLLHDKVKRAIESTNDDKQKWHQKTVEQVAAPVHDLIMDEVRTREDEIKRLQEKGEAAADATLTAKIADLEENVANLDKEQTAAKETVAKFFTAITEASTPEEVQAALSELATATGNVAPESLPTAAGTGTDNDENAGGSGDETGDTSDKQKKKSSKKS